MIIIIKEEIKKSFLVILSPPFQQRNEGITQLLNVPIILYHYIDIVNVPISATAK